MIKSKKDYVTYIQADKVALNIPKMSIALRLKYLLLPNRIWEFQKLLRKLEYYKNVKTKKSIIFYLPYLIYKRKFQNLSVKLNFSIPENVFGSGLAIVHYGTIVVNSSARVGVNCRIHACTNIGASGGESGAPDIGDNVYIGPGAKIYGDIKIPNNTVIAANAAVGRTFKNENRVLGGVPAKEVKEVDVKRIIKQLR